jgi:hypothetical protein
MKAVKEDSPVFDPSKAYTWDHSSTFTLNGAEFGMVLNALRATLSTPEAQRLFLAMRANDIIEDQLAKAVASGVAVERPEENK